MARFLTTSLTPVWSGQGERVAGVALLHSITRTMAVAELHEPVELDLARDVKPEDGLSRMCASGRRVRNLADPSHERWDFVPALLAHPRADVTHGYCGTCFRLHFPDQR